MRLDSIVASPCDHLENHEEISVGIRSSYGSKGIFGCK